MAITIDDADAYISQYCIDIEDWTESDAARKQRLMNVAERVLTGRYAQYTIPDNAVYDFANNLAIRFNDTNKLQQQGVKGFNVSGVASFTFDGGEKSFEQMIPQSTLQLIGDENGAKLAGRRTGRTVL